MFDSLIKFFADLKSSKKATRSPFVISIIALIVVIPMLLAIFYGYFYDDTVILTSDKVKIELFNKDGLTIFSGEADLSNLSESRTVEILYSLHNEKTESDKEIPTSSVPSFRFTVKSETVNERYDCYFTESVKTSYIKDKSGKVYSLPSDAYISFLLSEHSEALYEASTPPALITGNGEEVFPSKVDLWQYRRVDGKLIKSKSTLTVSQVLTYKIGGAINLAFEKMPDECVVSISDANGNLIHSGSLDDLSTIPVNKGEVLTAHVEAKWNENEQSDFCGALSYDFYIVVGDRAEFSVSSNEIYPGQFVVISVTNVDDVSKIIYSSKARRDIGSDADKAFNQLYEFVPTFVKDGKYAKAILPIPTGLSEYVFGFSVSYGAAYEYFEISIKNTPESSTHTLSNVSNDLLASVSSSAQNELSKLFQSIPASPQNMILWKESFVSLSDLGFTAGYSYNDTIIYNDDGDLFISKGCEYIAPSADGASVPTLNTGRVIQTGHCDALGNYVIVDHGMGLRTWYCHLSDVDVTEGAVVAKGDTVGKCSNNGAFNSNGVLILCSVYEMLIDPDFIIGNKINT